MIVPIIQKIDGEDQTIGAARVLPNGEDVEFYLKSEFSISSAVKTEMAKQLKKLARR